MCCRRSSPSRVCSHRCVKQGDLLGPKLSVFFKAGITHSLGEQRSRSTSSPPSARARTLCSRAAGTRRAAAHRRVLRGGERLRRDDVGAIFTSSAAGAGSRSDPPLCALGHGGACGRAGSDAIAAALATIPPPPPSSPPPPTPPQQPAKITKSKTEVLFVAALPHTHANPSTYNGADLSYVLLPGAGTSSRSSLSSATSATCLRSVITEKILPTSSSPS